MVRSGGVLAFFGFGSALLHVMGLQFTVLAWAEPTQPLLGLGIGALGAALLVITFRRRKRKLATPESQFSPPPGGYQPLSGPTRQVGQSSAPRPFSPAGSGSPFAGRPSDATQPVGVPREPFAPQSGAKPAATAAPSTAAGPVGQGEVRQMSSSLFTAHVGAQPVGAAPVSKAGGASAAEQLESTSPTAPIGLRSTGLAPAGQSAGGRGVSPDGQSVGQARSRGTSVAQDGRSGAQPVAQPGWLSRGSAAEGDGQSAVAGGQPGGGAPVAGQTGPRAGGAGRAPLAARRGGGPSVGASPGKPASGDAADAEKAEQGVRSEKSADSDEPGEPVLGRPQFAPRVKARPVRPRQTPPAGLPQFPPAPGSNKPSRG